MKYVVTYEAADDVRSKAPIHYAAHAARARDFHARGDLLMIGIFADPQADGAMGIFPSRDAAEAFVRNDPFVVHGVVQSWQIREWNEVLEPEGPTAASGVAR